MLQMNRRPRHIHIGSRCVLQLYEAILSVPGCLHTLFAHDVAKPWLANTSPIVTVAVKRLTGRDFQRLW